MDEREMKIQHLQEVVGLDRGQAERRLLDDDLWLTPATHRYILEGEEGIQQWREAVEAMRGLVNGLANLRPGNDAFSQLLVDTLERGEEVQRRVSERARVA